MIKSNVFEFFRENVNETIAYPCSCGYIATSVEYRGNYGVCVSCGSSELATLANPSITLDEAETAEPLMFRPDWSFQASG